MLFQLTLAALALTSTAYANEYPKYPRAFLNTSAPALSSTTAPYPTLSLLVNTTSAAVITSSTASTSTSIPTSATSPITSIGVDSVSVGSGSARTSSSSNSISSTITIESTSTITSTTTRYTTITLPASEIPFGATIVGGTGSTDSTSSFVIAAASGTASASDPQCAAATVTITASAPAQVTGEAPATITVTATIAQTTVYVTRSQQNVPTSAISTGVVRSVTGPSGFLTRSRTRGGASGSAAHSWARTTTVIRYSTILPA